MTGLLISVASVDEAEIAVSGGADIVDFKDPVRGAFGALPLERVRAGVARVGGRALTSATIGDFDAEVPHKVIRAIEATAETGVDLIAIALRPGGDLLDLLRTAAPLANKHRLVAVLFADLDPDFGLLQAIRDADFEGVMLDTAHKDGGELLTHVTAEQLELFVDTARNLDLLCGLAGRLRSDDIEPLAALAPDYFGFHTAACRGGVRGAPVDPARVAELRAALTACAESEAGGDDA